MRLTAHFAAFVISIQYKKNMNNKSDQCGSGLSHQSTPRSDQWAHLHPLPKNHPTRCTHCFSCCLCKILPCCYVAFVCLYLHPCEWLLTYLSAARQWGVREGARRDFLGPHNSRHTIQSAKHVSSCTWCATSVLFFRELPDRCFSSSRARVGTHVVLSSRSSSADEVVFDLNLFCLHLFALA